jgi:hypothetical protein
MMSICHIQAYAFMAKKLKTDNHVFRKASISYKS